MQYGTQNWAVTRNAKCEGKWNGRAKCPLGEENGNGCTFSLHPVGKGKAVMGADAGRAVNLEACKQNDFKTVEMGNGVKLDHDSPALRILYFYHPEAIPQKRGCSH